MEPFLHEKVHSRYKKAGITNRSLHWGSNLEYLNLHRGEQVLELGCGTGRETVRAAILVGKYGQAVGLDLIPESLITARQNAREKGIENIVFIKSSIESLPFDNDSFDAILGNCVMHHTPEKEKVYAEIFRVLKSGGRFVVSEAVRKKPLPGHRKNDSKQHTACLSGAVTEEDYLHCIRSAGFLKINILNTSPFPENGYDLANLTIKAVKKRPEGNIQQKNTFLRMAGPQCKYEC